MAGRAPLRFAALAALACLAAGPATRPAGAQGCGPTRLKVSESVVVDVPPAKLWAVVGDFQDMGWDGAVVAASGSGASAVGAVRTLRLRDGAVLSESLYRFDAAAMTYSTHVDAVATDRLPVQNAALTLSVAAEGGGSRSRLTWRSAFYRLLKPGETSPDAADAEASRAMSAFLRSGLDGLRLKRDAPPDPRT